MRGRLTLPSGGSAKKKPPPRVGRRQGTTGAEADADEGVGGLHPSCDVGERRMARWTRPSKGGPCRDELQEGNMSAASTATEVSPELLKVAERAKRDPS